MTRAELEQAGKALYGERWQSPLARDLGVSDRTMRRWVAGGDVPDGVQAEVARLLRARRQQISAILRAP